MRVHHRLGAMAAGAALALLTGGLGSPAAALGSFTSSDGGTGARTDTVRGCAVVSTAAYLGVSCGSGGRDGRSPKEILGDSDVPDCWQQALTVAELSALGLRIDDPAGRWYWERCLTGIDPSTKRLEPGGIDITIGLVQLQPGRTTTLDGNQQELVALTDRTVNVPSPVALTSPSVQPRVGSWVSFFNASEDELSVSTDRVELRARVTGISVLPYGDRSAGLVACEGSGVQAEPGDSPLSLPQGCWHRYQRSSAGERGTTGEGVPAFPVVISATWEVETVVGGVATPFNSFTKSSITQLPVTEIQALVIG